MKPGFDWRQPQVRVTAIEAKYFRKARTGRVGASGTAAGDHPQHITGGQPAFKRLENLSLPLS